jgi:hypothetical protein
VPGVPLEALLGPLAALALALTVISFLAKLLLDYIGSLKDTIVHERSQTVVALAGWKAQSTASERMAEAIETSNRDAEMRDRLTPAPRRR